jgi:hypothetical protein
MLRWFLIVEVGKTRKGYFCGEGKVCRGIMRLVTQLQGAAKASLKDCSHNCDPIKELTKIMVPIALFYYFVPKSERH